MCKHWPQKINVETRESDAGQVSAPFSSPHNHQQDDFKEEAPPVHVSPTWQTLRSKEPRVTKPLPSRKENDFVY